MTTTDTSKSPKHARTKPLPKANITRSNDYKGKHRKEDTPSGK